MAAAEAALDKADLFVCHCMAQQLTKEEVGTKSEDANPSNSTNTALLGTASGKLGRLDNTICPTD